MRSNNNYRKTMLEDFLEKHPNAILLEDGTPIICPYWLGYGEKEKKECGDDEVECLKCWNRFI